jgi:hypothetical protein
MVTYDAKLCRERAAAMRAHALRADSVYLRAAYLAIAQDWEQMAREEEALTQRQPHDGNVDPEKIKPQAQ